jgi:membrane protein
VKTFRSIVIEFYQAWMTERPARLAAALAYYGMFAFAPIVFVVLKVAGLFLNEVLLAQEFYALVAQLLGVEMADFVQDLVFGASMRGSGATPLSTIISVIALLYAATGLFNQLRHALNTIWHAGDDVRGGIGGFLIGRLLSFLLVIGLGVGLVIAIFASVAISTLRSVLDIASEFQIAGILIPLVMIYVATAVIYKILPDVSIGWRYIWIGSAVTTALVGIGGIAILIYLRISSVGSAFEAAGSLAVLLIGIYYVAQIFLAGALLTRILASPSAKDTA